MLVLAMLFTCTLCCLSAKPCSAHQIPMRSLVILSYPPLAIGL